MNKFCNNRKKLSLLSMLAAASLMILSTVAVASPPHPDLVEQIKSGQKAEPYFLKNLSAMRTKGINSPERFEPFAGTFAASKTVVKSPEDVTTFKVLAILVQFGDNTSQVSAEFFDSLIFDEAGYTVHDYYSTVSFGQIDLVTVNLPSVAGWQTAPQPYAYYVDGQNGTGSYPNNTQKLVEDMVDAVNASVDFSEYDNDNNGTVDVLIVIHSGTGAEYSGSDDDIWSHKWAIIPKYVDGVWVSDFTIQPEYWTSPGDMTIGVYAHELGHGFGLPDLYDTDYSSKGVGKWCIMSYGSWLGPLSRGGRPAQFCAWAKKELGIVTPTNITANVEQQPIGNATDNAEAYRLWNTGSESDEYFLIENRQKTGYDTYLPGSGLLIWHIDDAKANNTKEWYPGLSTSDHSMVALEQADGLYELEYNSDNGDAGDPFPGTYNQSNFNSLSNPSSDAYDGTGSLVGVEDISLSASTMHADLIVGLSAGTEDNEDDNQDEGDNTNPGSMLPQGVNLSQNYPNPFNPETHIAFTIGEAGEVTIDVFNVAGQRIKVLLNTNITAGEHEVIWDGTDEQGSNVASGIYFYRILGAGSQDVKKMVLLR
ncbi:MAG TPA: M6 family metalloprotease domain-containing protein [candidate division Zixibacteria bacterium]|nr:M6 family metalloprotease domain-containing protein [candidate division Zixibacteria bacterium]